MGIITIIGCAIVVFLMLFFCFIVGLFAVGMVYRQFHVVLAHDPNKDWTFAEMHGAGSYKNKSIEEIKKMGEVRREEGK